MTNRYKYPDTVINKAIGYFISGLGRSAISRKINVPEGTIRKWLDKYKNGELTHSHYWVLPSPNGPVCEGKCPCGETKTFPNSMDGMDAWRRSDGKRPKSNSAKDALATKKRKKRNFNGTLS